MYKDYYDIIKFKKIEKVWKSLCENKKKLLMNFKKVSLLTIQGYYDPSLTGRKLHERFPLNYRALLVSSMWLVSFKRRE